MTRGPQTVKRQSHTERLYTRRQGERKVFQASLSRGDETQLNISE